MSFAPFNLNLQFTWSGLSPGGTQVYSSSEQPESSSEWELRCCRSAASTAACPARAGSFTSPDMPPVVTGSGLKNERHVIFCHSKQVI